MYIFLLVRIFPITVYSYSFSKFELSNKICRKTKSKILFLIFKHVFFFQYQKNEVFYLFLTKSFYQIKSPLEAYSGASFEHIFFESVFFQFAKISKICQKIDFSHKYHLWNFSNIGPMVFKQKPL